ncbi:hypothetical protein ACFVHW_29410 [Streptomyces sp. NPDC127110]|uniref:hypothetical protein n=1 Tax=Streptomyces sp. NPDC127110 TaxID=3345362 RepID=UPI0036430160
MAAAAVDHLEAGAEAVRELDGVGARPVCHVPAHGDLDALGAAHPGGGEQDGAGRIVKQFVAHGTN